MRWFAALFLGCALLAGCSDDAARSGGAGNPPEGRSGAGSATTQDPAEPLGWGPTAGELVQAEELVADMSPEELAGQVIVGRYAGTDPAVPGSLVRELHLAGVCVTSDNVVDEGQVRATTRAVTRAHGADGRTHPAIIGVDQEGGVVSHLDGIATDFPAFAAAGTAIQTDPRAGRSVVRKAAAATALELRMLGFTWVFAPVADVTIGAADPTIGTRSPSGDPRTAAAATRAAVTGYQEAGLVSTTKHYPGHGAATSDSHEVLPVIDTPLGQLRSRDLLPFESAIDAGAPAIMIGHLDVQAIAPGTPSSLAPEVYDHLRDDLGFEGVAITDSMGMGAVLGNGGLPAVDALKAGADLLLMPADTAGTHATVSKAIKDGRIDRARVEEAAARVVALQLWQQRRAEQVRVPADVVRRAQDAAAALTAA
ncbi:MAG: glycoside hydrolase family 3 protein, partial [Nocardioides sp.]